MKKIILIALMSTFACGGKAKKTTTPENKGSSTTEVKGAGSSTGGTTYGGAMTPTSGGADPCAGQ